MTGEDYVTSGSYHIINSINSRVIHKTSLGWSHSVYPGTKVAMSVILDSKEPAACCPRYRQNLNNPSANDEKQICSPCSWERYLDTDQRVGGAITMHLVVGIVNSKHYEGDFSRGYLLWDRWRYNEVSTVEYQWSGPSWNGVYDRYRNFYIR
ncbi:hypothetical protein AOQ84DRAFT_377342 [Glonium stellatum]|uniref:Uncharacterized protein n=1 Tax=Glonium stellatum TaxID=574774 RepID=A0A8E2F019_9PEZI|nr:hypothetical protein AOQ84DRAFT_377342 [Glonium stellatum]